MPLKEKQRLIVDDKRRFKVAVCGRRFGKTTLAIWLMCREAAQPEREVWYIAPTYRQAKMIAWKKLKKKLVDLRWAKKVNETELSILLKNGSTISLKGADGGAQNLRGIGLNAVIFDEAAIIEQEAWTEVIRPALADKQGWALFISTPAGMNWLKDLYDLAYEYPEEWASFQFTSLDGGNIPPQEIEAAQRSLGEREFRQEFLATFEEYAGRVYYAFDRTKNVKEYKSAYPVRNIMLGIDFNIDPMSCVIAVRDKDDLYVIDEIRMFSSNTQELVAEILQRYSGCTITAFPDPASRQRKTSAGGLTDFSILQNAGLTVRAPAAHTPIRDRVNAVNARLCDSTGQRRLFIAPGCKYTIEGLERHTYKEGTSQPDTTSEYVHQMDALGYLVDAVFPLRPKIEKPEVGFWTHRLAQ